MTESGRDLARLPVRREFGVRIPMRDGVHLTADLWRPRSEGAYPAILMRTPYLRTMEKLRFTEYGEYFASRGYALVVQDVRGRGDSEGEFGFFAPDIPDGYDTVEWLAERPWSTGRVGMMGVSYLGSVQWLAARARPPHLVCIVPTAAATMDVIYNYLGGAFLMDWAIPWTQAVTGRIYQSVNARGVDWDEVYSHRPLRTLDEALGRPMPLYREFAEYPDFDPHWDPVRFRPEVFREIDLPALHVTGWFDGDQPSAFHYWNGMAEHSPAAESQHLLAGPWTHEQTFLGGETALGDMEFSADSVVDTKALHLAFFEHHLKQAAPRFDFPRARVFVTGADRWRDFDHYPPAEAEPRRLYLHSGGRANSSFGDGTLSWEEPGDEPEDRYRYDPLHPVPSRLNGEELPLDHRPVQRRDDVLVYTSERLTEPVEVIGKTFVELFAASDARDTDFTAKISDVYPDGRAIKLGTLPVGVVRARYRNGYDEEELLVPGQAERYRIELFDFAHAFLPGHRIRIEISSSAYPFVAPNPNTGNPVMTDTEWNVAHQAVYHDRGRPSAVVLPVMRS